MTEENSQPGTPTASLPELQAKLSQTQQAVKEKDVQLARVVEKMREFKSQIAQDKKSSNDAIQSLEARLQTALAAVEAEKERNRALQERTSDLVAATKKLEQSLAEVTAALEEERSHKTPRPEEMFSIAEERPVPVEGAAAKEPREECAAASEVEELRLQLEAATRQNEQLAAELKEAKDTGNAPLQDSEAALLRRTEERDECRADNARLAKKVKELLKSQQATQGLRQSLQQSEEERNSLRAEYAKAQTEWLSQEQERMDSFKVMLQEVEQQSASEKEKSQAEIAGLQEERQNIRNKIYQEFADQVQVKTDLIAEFDAKLQQSQRRESDSNSKLIALRQQLQDSTETAQRHLQATRDLEKEKEKLLQEGHTVQTALDAKCTQLHQQVQQLQKRLKKKDQTAEEPVVDKSSEPLQALRVKHQLAKREVLRVLEELKDSKRAAAESAAEQRLEIVKYKSIVAELQKFLHLDAFTASPGLEFESKKTVQEVELQGMEMEQPFGEVSQAMLEERVSALLANCDQALTHLRDAQRQLNEDKANQDSEGKISRELQQTHAEIERLKSHAMDVSKCATDLHHYYQEMGDNLSNLSARLCDEASCSLGIKMMCRALLKSCGASSRQGARYTQLKS